MAEGLINHDLGDRWFAISAGTAPAGYVHPLAVQVMDEIGVNLSGQRSKSVDEFHAQRFDLVVTVCDSAAADCPVWLGPERRVHFPFPDPAQAGGTIAERLPAFRTVRDQIRSQLLPYLAATE